MLLLIHPHGDNVNIDETIISHVYTYTLTLHKKKIVMLLTPISNYSIYAHMSVSTLDHANSHLNILIRRNKFIFLYIKQNDCGQDGGNVENFLLWLQYSLSLSLFVPFQCCHMYAINFYAADCYSFCCISSNDFQCALYASTGFCGSLNLHWLFPTTELGIRTSSARFSAFL